MNAQTRLGRLKPVTSTWRSGPYTQAPIAAPTMPTNASVNAPPGGSPGMIQRAASPTSKPRTIQKATAPSTLLLLAAAPSALVKPYRWRAVERWTLRHYEAYFPLPARDLRSYRRHRRGGTTRAYRNKRVRNRHRRVTAGYRDGQGPTPDQCGERKRCRIAEQCALRPHRRRPREAGIARADVALDYYNVRYYPRPQVMPAT